MQIIETLSKMDSWCYLAIWRQHNLALAGFHLILVYIPNKNQYNSCSDAPYNLAAIVQSTRLRSNISSIENFPICITFLTLILHVSGGHYGYSRWYRPWSGTYYYPYYQSYYYTPWYYWGWNDSFCSSSQKLIYCTFECIFVYVSIFLHVRECFLVCQLSWSKKLTTESAECLFIKVHVVQTCMIYDRVPLSTIVNLQFRRWEVTAIFPM